VIRAPYLVPVCEFRYFRRPGSQIKIISVFLLSTGIPYLKAEKQVQKQENAI
jgi:hypothetical protein